MTDDQDTPRETGNSNESKANGGKATSNATALAALGIVMLVGLAAIVIFAARLRVGVSPWSILGVGVVVAGASALGGGLLGFLFGIPRAASTSQGAAYRANTNLEDISDWLTKILVGVGLTQIATFPGWLARVSAFFAEGLGGSDASPTVAAAILVYFSIAGFLFAYLWTRLYLAGALAHADRQAIEGLQQQLEQTKEKLEKKVEAIQTQTDFDTAALILVERQLSLSAGIPDIPQPDLDTAVSAASTSARIQIYNNAHQQRVQNWREANKKPVMERTIPVFRALVAADAEGRYHGNYGQLGFALKDQRVPDYAGALAALEKAIELRGPWQERGWTYYELNRAVCNIMLDPDYKQDRTTGEPHRAVILADLQAAYVDLPEVVERIGEIRHWLERNNISLGELRALSGPMRT